MPSQKHVFQRSVYFGHNDNTYVYYIIEMRPSCTLRCTAAAIPTWRPNYPHYYAAIQHYCPTDQNIPNQNIPETEPVQSFAVETVEHFVPYLM